MNGLNELSEPVVMMDYSDKSQLSKSPRIDQVAAPPEKVVSKRSIASMAVAKTQATGAQVMPSQSSVKVQADLAGSSVSTKSVDVQVGSSDCIDHATQMYSLSQSRIT